MVGHFDKDEQAFTRQVILMQYSGQNIILFDYRFSRALELSPRLISWNLSLGRLPGRSLPPVVCLPIDRLLHSVLGCNKQSLGQISSLMIASEAGQETISEFETFTTEADSLQRCI